MSKEEYVVVYDENGNPRRIKKSALEEQAQEEKGGIGVGGMILGGLAVAGAAAAAYVYRDEIKQEFNELKGAASAGLDAMDKNSAARHEPKSYDEAVAQMNGTAPEESLGDKISGKWADIKAGFGAAADKHDELDARGDKRADLMQQMKDVRAQGEWMENNPVKTLFAASMLPDAPEEKTVVAASGGPEAPNVVSNANSDRNHVDTATSPSVVTPSGPDLSQFPLLSVEALKDAPNGHAAPAPESGSPSATDLAAYERASARNAEGKPEHITPEELDQAERVARAGGPEAYARAQAAPGGNLPGGAGSEHDALPTTPGTDMHGFAKGSERITMESDSQGLPDTGTDKHGFTQGSERISAESERSASSNVDQPVKVAHDGLTQTERDNIKSMSESIDRAGGPEAFTNPARLAEVKGEPDIVPLSERKEQMMAESPTQPSADFAALLGGTALADIAGIRSSMSGTVTGVCDPNASVAMTPEQPAKLQEASLNLGANVNVQEVSAQDVAMQAAVVASGPEMAAASPGR